MKILYKYCDPRGGIKILRNLELRLPYISQVNDPLECLPRFYCTEDHSKVKERSLLALRRNNVLITDEILAKLNGDIASGSHQEWLLRQTLHYAKLWNNHKGCLLSVSETAQNTVMWAHYARRHEGLVIGIDFKLVTKPINGYQGLLMEKVTYSNERQAIDISLDQNTPEWWDLMGKALLTKSTDWQYEREHRTIFHIDSLQQWRHDDLARAKKNIFGYTTWFLRLDPISIKEIIFGLYATQKTKSAIKKLADRPTLQHVKLFQVAESKAYDFDLIEEK